MSFDEFQNVEQFPVDDDVDYSQVRQGAIEDCRFPYPYVGVISNSSSPSL